MSAQSAERRTTLLQLQKRAREGEKLVMLTSYDASFARISDEAGVDMLLIGDSLGMVIQGHDSTLAVTLEQTVYHVECVVRGSAPAGAIPHMT
jgi:3-methyl-2-oxobutanoate hydroxymethyltransferase